MQSKKTFGAVAAVLGLVLLTYVSTLACARRISSLPSASGPTLLPDAGVVSANKALLPTTSVVSASKALLPAAPTATDSAANEALEARILNPYDARASVSSAPPTHHVTANFEEDLSLDLVNAADSAGRDVWFKAEALAPATAVRGRVLRGGKNARQPICSKWSDGGGGLQVGIEVLHNGTWRSIGWVLYGHVQDMTVNDGDIVESGTSIAKVTALRDNNYCSTGGHLHLGFSDTAHHPCWAVERRVSMDGPIAQVGGNRESLAKCLPPTSDQVTAIYPPRDSSANRVASDVSPGKRGPHERP